MTLQVESAIKIIIFPVSDNPLKNAIKAGILNEKITSYDFLYTSFRYLYCVLVYFSDLMHSFIIKLKIIEWNEYGVVCVCVYYAHAPHFNYNYNPPGLLF